MNKPQQKIVAFGCLAFALLLVSVQFDVPQLQTSGEDATRLKTMCVIYGTATLTGEQMDRVAEFDMLVTQEEMTQATLAGIKQRNPNTKILTHLDLIASHDLLNTKEPPYWDEVNSHEDWFIHNLAGNRIRNHYWLPDGWFLMDINSGWRDFLVGYANNERHLGSPYVDGVLMDDAVNQIRWTISAGVFSDAVTGEVMTEADFDPAFMDNWYTDMTAHLNYLRSGLNPNKLFIANVEDRSPLNAHTQSAIDGRCDEGFGEAIHGSLISAIDRLATESAVKPYYLMTHLDDQTNPNQAKYIYAAAHLGMNSDECYFSYRIGDGIYGYEQTTQHYPQFITGLGDPSGQYSSTGNGVYKRDFANGLVLLNDADTSTTIELGDTYKLAHGDDANMTSITLQPKTGEFLYLADQPTPPTEPPPEPPPEQPPESPPEQPTQPTEPAWFTPLAGLIVCATGIGVILTGKKGDK